MSKRSIEYTIMVNYINEEEKRIEELLSQSLTYHPPKKISTNTIIEENTINSSRSTTSNHSETTSSVDFEYEPWHTVNNSFENCFNPYEYRKYKTQLDQLRHSKRKYNALATKPTQLSSFKQTEKEPNQFLERITSDSVVNHFADFQKFRENEKSRWSTFLEGIGPRKDRVSKYQQLIGDEKENQQRTNIPQTLVESKTKVMVPLLQLHQKQTTSNMKKDEEYRKISKSKTVSNHYKYYSTFKEALQPYFTGLEPKNAELLMKCKKEAILRWREVDEFFNNDRSDEFKKKYEENMLVFNQLSSSSLTTKRHFSEMKRNKSETAILTTLSAPPQQKNEFLTLPPIPEKKLVTKQTSIENSRPTVTTPPPPHLLRMTKSTGSIHYGNKM